MGTDATLTVVIAFLTLCFLISSAAMGVFLRVILKFSRSESKLNMLADDLKELIENKDRIHAELVAQMGRDRDATDRRLRYLEEWHMKHGT